MTTNELGETAAHDFSSIPATACMMRFAEVELGDNGNDAKSAPVKIKARSGQFINHWFWGRVVHDFSGMKIHKNRLPLDYNHDAGEVLGYANHFDFSTGDLIASGALTPWKADDRASEVMFKMREGVPYEASIYFGGDGIKYEEIEAGRAVEVNGTQFEGPGVVIREWPLRGIAICLYGADSNTESMSFSEKKTIAATEWSKPQEDDDMTTEEKPVEELAEQAVEAEGAAEEETPVEAAPVEAEAEEEKEPEAVEDDAEAAALKAEVEELRAMLAAQKENTEELAAKLAALQDGQPPVSAADDETKKLSGSWFERARMGVK